MKRKLCVDLDSENTAGDIGETRRSEPTLETDSGMPTYMRSMADMCRSTMSSSITKGVHQPDLIDCWTVWCGKEGDGVMLEIHVLPAKQQDGMLCIACSMLSDSR